MGMVPMIDVPAALSARPSLLLSFAEKYTVLLLGIVSSMWLSRLLTPAEVGLYALGAVLVALAQVVRDFGVGQYLVQEKSLDRPRLRAALAAGMLVAGTLALLVALVSWPLANWYREPRLALVLQLLAINFLLLPWSALTLAMLRRQQRGRAIYAINVANGLANLLVAVALALLGASYLSLVWGALAGNLASLLMSLLLRPAGLPWLPSWRGLRAVLGFGTLSTGGSLLDEAGVAAPDLVIARLIDLHSLALFGKAQSVLNLFNQAISSAVSPVLFALFAASGRQEGQQSGQDRQLGQVRALYLRTVSCMTALAWPFFLLLACLAPPLVQLLYGAQWADSSPLIRIMCLPCAVYSMFSMGRYLLVASGQLRAQVAIDGWSALVKIALVLAAAPFGLQAVALAVALSLLWRSWLSYRCLQRLHGAGGLALLRSVRKSLALCVLASPAPLCLLWLPAGLAPGWCLLALLSGALATLLCWLAGVCLLRHELNNELLLLRQHLAERLRRARRASKGEPCV